MRFLAALAVAAGALLLVVGLFSYLVLPGLIESHLATSLQGRYGLEEKPAVEVALGFPPGLLLGRIDWVEVRMDWLKREGLLLRNVHIDLRDVSMLIFARRPGA
ncbi:MAG: LmeA family phospholipid-binding protein [Rubrobacter sp.]|nr:LmeA family phospholipid-binding protein [Rubrobacter sp.]